MNISLFQAFLLININLMIVFIIGKYINGYVLTYLLLMLTCVFYKMIIPLLKFFKNIKQDLGNFLFNKCGIKLFLEC